MIPGDNSIVIIFDPQPAASVRLEGPNSITIGMVKQKLIDNPVILDS